MIFDYLKDPQKIYEKSFSSIDSEVDFSPFPPHYHPMVRRLVHSCAMVEVAEDLVCYGDVVQAAHESFVHSGRVFVDAHMVDKGLIRRFFPSGVEVICTLDDPQVMERAKQLKTTRSAAGVDLWQGRLHGSVVVIGNAPTALFHLLEIMTRTQELPQAILAFPVGFVGAKESKQALIEHHQGVPFITLPGRRGGSAMAAGAFNGLCEAFDG